MVTQTSILPNGGRKGATFNSVASRPIGLPKGSWRLMVFGAGICYNPKGQRERIKYGNGATTKYEYDEKTFRLTRLWSFRNGGTENLQDLNYIYDPVGNITKITDNAQKVVFFDNQQVNPSQEFKYDALYRLIEATGREHSDNGADTGIEIDGYPNVNTPIPNDATALRNYTRMWEYDDVGNILKLIHNANNGNGNWNRTYNYENDNNRLISTKVGEDAVNYTYNEHGSMATMPHLQNMEWDFAERLGHVTRGTTEAYYNYDGSGERVRKVVEKGGVIETRLYLGGFEIFRKKAGGNLELERETLHIMDDTRRIALVETKTRENGNQVANPTSVQRYQLSNNIESAALELDESANIISYEEYYPYGDTSYRAGRSASEVSQKRYRYTGKEKDEESGLYYHGARYYACWLGRWTAADPAGMVDGGNLYVYCRGNPIRLVDNTGKHASGVSDNIDSSPVPTIRYSFDPINIIGTPPLENESVSVGQQSNVCGKDEAVIPESANVAAAVQDDTSPVNNLGQKASPLRRAFNWFTKAGTSLQRASSWFKKTAISVYENVVKIGTAAMSNIKNSAISVYGKIAEISGKIASDINNFNWSNENEQAVIDSNYFSAYKGQLVVRHPFSFLGSMSLGIMFLQKSADDNKNADTDLVNHEHGHFRQLQKLGFLVYLFGIGIPSVIGTFIYGKNPDAYFNQRQEISADDSGGVVRGSHTTDARNKGEKYMALLKRITSILNRIPLIGYLNMFLMKME
ncbi:MAG: RHS repeat-associated core domain-containing protein [Prevotellaceae bacterium]|jgi:RHS repeat-associated protein|nr:RHS repeat-associated core domain-containing protein [Prevotellaceae bacterium]